MFFQVIPEVIQTTNRLRLEPAKISRFLSLGCYYKSVTIDRAARKVFIETQWLWGCFKNHREISFTEILDVETEYDAFKDKQGHDSYQIFTILLKIRTDYISKVPIAVFKGSAGFALFSSGRAHKEAFDSYFDKLLICLGRKSEVSKRPFIFPSIVHEDKPKRQTK